MTAKWDAQKVAARGAEFLSKREPGWCERIDLPTLDLGNPAFCVLGQLHGYYADGLHYLRVGNREYTLGFHVPYEPSYHGFSNELWEPLTEAWRAEIERCRAAATPDEPR